MILEFKDGITNGSELCNTIYMLPALEGYFRIDGVEDYYSRNDLIEFFVNNYNSGKRIFDVLYLKSKTDALNKAIEEENNKIREMFKEISSTEEFKRDLKAMLDEDML